MTKPAAIRNAHVTTKIAQLPCIQSENGADILIEKALPKIRSAADVAISHNNIKSLNWHARRKGSGTKIATLP
jgi:hypothetical protein